MVQDAFVRVVKNAGDFKHAARFSTWLYTIARNLCVDEARKRVHRKHPSLDQPGRGSDGDGPTLGEQTGDSAIGVRAAGSVGAAYASVWSRGRSPHCPTTSERCS